MRAHSSSLRVQRKLHRLLLCSRILYFHQKDLLLIDGIQTSWKIINATVPCGAKHWLT